MFTPSNKTMHPLQVFSIKSSSTPTSSSSSISSMKLKRIIHTLIVSHMCRIIRAISKVKEVIVEILRDNSSLIQFPYASNSSHKKRHSSKNKCKNIILGSFRLHYNWCSSKSSHVLPVPQRVYEGLHHPTTHNNVTNIEGEDNCPESQLAGYLRWLEEKKVLEDGVSRDEEKEMNEIDMLAEMFIANCHEKFKLEKQESDRRFQEMLARSM